MFINFIGYQKITLLRTPPNKDILYLFSFCFLKFEQLHCNYSNYECLVITKWISTVGWPQIYWLISFIPKIYNYSYGTLIILDINDLYLIVHKVSIENQHLLLERGASNENGKYNIVLIIYIYIYVYMGKITS